MQLPLSRARYSAFPFSIDSGVAATGFFVFSASAGSSHVFFEKSCCAPPPEGWERMDLESFEFLLVVVELFEFCADDFTATSKEVTNITDAATNSENAKRGKIDFRIDGSPKFGLCTSCFVLCTLNEAPSTNSQVQAFYLVRFFLTGFRVAGLLVVVLVAAAAAGLGFRYSATTVSGMSASQTTSLSLTLILRDFKIVCACLSGTASRPSFISPDSRLLMIFAVSVLSAFIAPRRLKFAPFIVTAA